MSGINDLNAQTIILEARITASPRPTGNGVTSLDATLLSAARARAFKVLEKPTVLEGQHPDSIEFDGSVTTEQVKRIREMRASVYVRPFECESKVYIIRNAHVLKEPAQNALLKILEEPPKYAVFYLLTDSSEKLLPTIRSRCITEPVDVTLSAEAVGDGELERKVQLLLGAIIKRSELAFASVLFDWVYMKKDTFSTLLQMLKTTFHEEMTVKTVTGLSAGALMEIIDAIDDIQFRLESNALVSACCGKLSTVISRQCFG